MNNPALRTSAVWKFLLGWLIVNVLWGIVTVVVTLIIAWLFNFGRVDKTVLALVIGFLEGASLGTAQAIVLQTRLPGAARWILATAIGSALGAAIITIATGYISAAVAPLMVPLLYGASLGVCQWFVLRVYSRSGLWVLISALACAVAVLFTQLVSSAPFPRYLDNWPGFAVIFLPYAAISGAGLLSLLQQPQIGTQKPGSGQ